jgi:hypothetical protein
VRDCHEVRWLVKAARHILTALALGQPLALLPSESGRAPALRPTPRAFVYGQIFCGCEFASPRVALQLWNLRSRLMPPRRPVAALTNAGARSMMLPARSRGGVYITRGRYLPHGYRIKRIPAGLVSPPGRSWRGVLPAGTAPAGTASAREGAAPLRASRASAASDNDGGFDSHVLLLFVHCVNPAAISASSPAIALAMIPVPSW